MIIKKIKKDNFEMIHFRFKNDFGELENYFELVVYHEDGRKTNIPFSEPLVVRDFSNSSFNKPQDFTENDYKLMFESAKDGLLNAIKKKNA